MQYGVRCVVMAALAAASGGCVAKTAFDVVTAPVKVVSKGVDLATTSQSEADEKRGRALRQREERLGRVEREHSRATQRCAGGDDRACDKADALATEMADLAPTVPAAPR